MKEMTLEEFLERKIKREKAKREKIEIKIDEDRSIICRKPEESEIIQLFGEAYRTELSFEETLAQNKAIIYACCEKFHLKEYQEKTECTVPEDIVSEFFTTQEIIAIAGKLGETMQEGSFAGIERIKKN